MIPSEATADAMENFRKAVQNQIPGTMEGILHGVCFVDAEGKPAVQFFMSEPGNDFFRFPKNYLIIHAALSEHGINEVEEYQEEEDDEEG